MAHRTFQVQSPLMEGEDIKAFQHDLNRILAKWDMDLRLDEDGYYGVGTRSVTASVCHANGFEAGKLMANGVTPWLRTKIRSYRRSAGERVRFVARVGYRRKLRARWAKRSVAPMTAKVIADSWGYHPGVHDGLDVITPAEAPIFAMCDGTITRVSAGGWWGKAPSGDVTKGDGVCILRCEVDQGPFRKGLNFVYGHSEKHTVREGQKVKAGDRLGIAGLAVAHHIHLCVNRRNDTRGVGDHDPRKYYTYAQKS